MSIQERYEEVKRFNEIAGNLNNVTAEKLEAQMKVFIEESKETADAFANKDSVELLDGICDSFVTLAGLMQMAEKVGFKVDEALKRVNQNNLDKFPGGFISDEDHEYYKQQGWKVDFSMMWGCCIIKDQNGKIRKPVGFKPVQIADLAPDVFAKKMTFFNALDEAAGHDKRMYIINTDKNFQKQFYVDEKGQIHWTHFGSVGGLIPTAELEKFMVDCSESWMVKDSMFGGVV